MSQIAYRKYIDIVIATIILLPLCFIFLGYNAIVIFLSLMVAYLVPRYIYRRQAFCTIYGEAALAIAFVSMGIFFILNQWQSVVWLGSVEVPHLLHDPLTYYLSSRDIAADAVDEYTPTMPYIGYPILLSLWVRVGVIDIAYPIIFNLFLVLCSMIVMARTVLFVLPRNKEAGRIAGYAMCLLSIIPSFVVFGMILQKEAFLVFGLVSVVCSLYALRDRHKMGKYALLFIVGVILVSMCRATYLYVLLFFVVAIFLPRFGKQDILPLVTAISFIFLFIWIGSLMSHWGKVGFVEMYVEEGASERFICGDSQLPYEKILGPYNTYPLWVKLLLLPICTGVQFMIPFPFVTAEPMPGMPLSAWYLRQSYLWYMAAIPMFGYYLFYWWRKGGVALSLFACASAIAYCVPAFITGGTVSRYAFCFAPFLAIVGGYAIHRIQHEKPERKRLLVFAVIYICLVAVALYIGGNPHLIIQYL